jgi:hypothetical protein
MEDRLVSLWNSLHSSRKAVSSLRQRFRSGAVRYLLPFITLSLLFLWTLWLGREYLAFNEDLVPAGREFSSAIQAHHLWTRVQDCGWCALWDGSERGGFPAFVDPLASSLFPLVALATLAFGVINGAKLVLLSALLLAGLAQLWLARELRLGWLGGLWTSMMAIAGGHLAGRMELGLFSLLLSMAMAAFIYPAAIRVSEVGDRRSTAVLGLALAMFALSGQGYVQAGMALISPAFLILVWKAPPGSKVVAKRFAQAIGIALLVASPFLVPFLHFLPNFVKDTDPTFLAAQPLGYYVLNLVIGDYAYLTSQMLDKLPYPHMYTMFVGWVPILFALACLRLAKKEDFRVIGFLATSAVLALIVGSGEVLKWASSSLPWLSALRFVPVVGGLAVPPILGLAGYGLQQFWSRRWPSIALLWSGRGASESRTFNLRLLLIIPLLLGLKSSYSFSHQWLFTEVVDQGVYDVLAALRTPDAEWVEAPFGEHRYIEPAVREGLKLSPGIMTWRWKDREMPVPVLEANVAGPPPDAIEVVREASGIPVYSRMAPPYAAVYDSDEWTACHAQSAGGSIVVQCQSPTPGLLRVEENAYSGWRAWRDGEPIPLRVGQFLSVAALEGEHTYAFRYLPWDVPLGLALSLVGLVICGGMLVWPKRDLPTGKDDTAQAETKSPTADG